VINSKNKNYENMWHGAITGLVFLHKITWNCCFSC